MSGVVTKENEFCSLWHPSFRLVVSQHEGFKEIIQIFICYLVILHHDHLKLELITPA